MKHDEDPRNKTGIRSKKNGTVKRDETEQLFRAVLDNHHVVMLIIEPETGIIEDASPAACAFYGYSKDELTKKRISEINTLAPDQILVRLQLAKTRQQKYFDFQHRLASGEIRDVEVCTGPIVVDGKTLLFSIINDVTDRKRAEAALLESEKNYRNLFKNAPIGIFQSTPEGTVLNVNPAYAQIFGFESPEQVMDSVKDVAAQLYLEPEKRERIIEMVLQHDRLLNFEIEYRRKDGTVFTGNLHLQVIRNDDGSVNHLEGFVEDITERKKAENELRDSEERYRAVFNNAAVGINLTDKDGKFVQVNSASERMLGYTQEEMKNLTFYDLTFPEDNELSREHLSALQSGEKDSYRLEKRYIRKDGEIIWADVSVSALRDVKGDYTSTLAVIVDVTERKRAERAIKESEARIRTKLDSILLPEGDIGTLELADVIDAPTIQALMDDFFGLTNIGVGIIDLKGEVLVATGWQEICTKFHRTHPETGKYCIESDTELTKSLQPGFSKMYRCKNKMWDIATPIVVGGKHLGNLFLGQFFFQDDETDYSTFREQARRYGFDEDEYLAALDKVPRWSKQTVDIVMAFYTKLARILSSLSYSNIKLARSLGEQEKLLNSLRESEQRYRAVVDNTEIGISVLDPDMQIVDVNKAFKKFFPHVRPSCGQICYEQYNDPPRSRPCEYCPCVLTLADGETHDAITETPAGSEIRSYHLISSPIKDSQGKVQYVIELTQDVTERKRGEEMLRQAESRYRRLFEHAPLIYVITRNEQGVPLVSDCNEPFLNVLGYSREEVMGQPLASFYSAASSTELIEGGGYARALAGDFLIGERQLLRRDGTYMPTLLYTSPEIDNSGEVIGTCAMFVDITEQKKAEEALLKSEAQLSSALTMAHLGHWEYDVSKDLFTFNDHFYKVYRTTAEQEGGYTMSSADYARRFVHPDDMALVAKEISKAIGTTDPNFSSNLEHRIIYPDGEIGYITVRYFVVKDDFGRTIATYGVNQDISDRKKAEEALRSEREQLLSIFESINEVILVIDPKSYEILYANKFTEDLYGTKLQGGKCYEKLGGLDAACRHCSMDSVMELGGNPLQWEYHSRSLNRDFLATDRMIRWPNGRDVKFQIAIDITERKLADQEKDSLRSQLVQAQKMEAIGTLAGGIAHDFNNLLQVILGYSELLLDEKIEGDPDRADLSKIHQAARSGADLVRNLLTFSRKTEPKPVPMSLNNEIRHVEKLLRRTIPRMIDIQLDLAEDLRRINADRGQIEQIIMNLAVNARDAMGEEGSLKIRTENVTLDEEYCELNVEAKPGDYVLLSVSDTGRGMDRETLQHIFEPFFTTKELGRGTGLGLAMVYGIVKQHGGNITCYSEVGLGTTFKIYLPPIEEQMERDLETSGEMPAFGTETVLIIDDEDLVRELGHRILARSGYKVLTAADGHEGLEVYRREKDSIALVILDLIMPTMGGKDCLQKILEESPQARVLIASGYSADASTNECIEMGAKGFVPKPFRFKELLRQVRKTLDQS